MSTRIGVFCDRLLEVGWLAALIVAPLFFNVYSSRVFEPDKISLLRSIAIIMAAAWLVKQLEAGIPRRSPRELFRTLRHENPLLLPTVAMVVVYIISTIFSVVPAVSLWGGYQRLQGTYSTFSYIVIFVIAASALRTRAQLNRAINVIIVVGFPIAFYGLLQHYSIDPLPWGGDTTLRVASNMGNAIFVAAYMIMVAPLAAARWIESLMRVTAAAETRSRAALLGAAGVALAVVAGALAFDFALGIGTLLAVLVLGILLSVVLRLDLREALLATTYTIILATLLIGIFFTQSRGPWLGLGGGLFAFVVLFALARGARRVVIGAIGLAMVGAAFLIVFNLPNTPLAPLKQVPYVGRLGEILDSNSPTAQVRELIWKGTVELLKPHAPLWSPTMGDDAYNTIRPLVGYGPESLYVAFNPFYTPELAHLEQRNASPDRAHNETFDSLVTTGLIGFGAYILLFISIFYYGLKWLGAITSAAERNLFIALWLAGGFLAALAFGLWRGWYYIGVALPAGMIVGLFIYLIIVALRHHETLQGGLDARKALWLSALVGALIGHYIEIHFGIAIVSTRTYFWFYAALLVLLGMDRLAEPAAAAPRPAAAPAAALKETAVEKERRRKRRRTAESPRPATNKGNAREIPLGPVLACTAIVSIIMVTLSYEFINNQIGVPSALEAVRHSLFYKGLDLSIGVFLLFVLTWVLAGFVLLGEEARNWRVAGNGAWLAAVLYAVLSLTVIVWYIVFQMHWLTQSGDLTDAFISILGLYYVALFVLMGALAVVLSFDVLPPKAVVLRAPANAMLAPVLSLAVVAAIYLTNFTGVSADILFKSAGNSDTAGTFDRSIDLYQRALGLAPTQDFYALFLGRAFLEGARSTTDANARPQMLASSEQVLKTAQQLAPLNTDHTANLARLNRLWAGLVNDPAQKAQHNQASAQYYQLATRLSPNTAYLYNEWSQTYSQSGEWDKARAGLEQSLKIDSQFAQTYLYLGDVYRAQSQFEPAVENYLKALQLDPGALTGTDGNPMPEVMAILAHPEFLPRTTEAFQAVLANDANNLHAHYALADLYKRTGQSDKARQELEQAAKGAPGNVMARLALVNFYSESGQIDSAVTAMRSVMELISPASNADYQRFQDFNAQLQNLQKAVQTAQKSPNDVGAHRTVAAMWKARGQPQFALPEYQIVARLAPNDYDANKNVALLNLQLGQTGAAQEAVTAAAALAPENEKPLWQNLVMALNAQKSQQWDQARQQAQAALALAPDADRPVLQAYVAMLQSQSLTPK